MKSYNRKKLDTLARSEVKKVKGKWLGEPWRLDFEQNSNGLEVELHQPFWNTETHEADAVNIRLPMNGVDHVK